MKALTVVPDAPGSLAVTDVPDPQRADGDLLVEGLAIGVCGTDREIADGDYGWPSDPGRRLVLGHESLGRVLEAPHDSGFSPGDLVAGVVRRPDPQPCGACARGQMDMCRNGGYTERGIKELDGYGSQLWTVEPDYAVAVDAALGAAGVLVEPASVVAKAWRQIDAVGGRAWFEPQRVLVTGAGPIGLLAAMIGAQRGLDVHVLDRAGDGPKPRLVKDLGATYHDGDAGEVAAALQADVVVEATGAGAVVAAVLGETAPFGVVCLTGVSRAGRRRPVDTGAVNRALVLENDVVVGSVNASVDDYRTGVAALAAADRGWLEGLITRRVPLGRAVEAFEQRADDVKVVVELGDGA